MNQIDHFAHRLRLSTYGVRPAAVSSVVAVERYRLCLYHSVLLCGETPTA
jgi:hypothetical protein